MISNKFLYFFRNIKECKHFYGSAATGYNIKEAFVALIKEINQENKLMIKGMCI